MTTGTEGNDELTNDRFVTDEVIDALGGDDRITIVDPDFQWEEQPTITVHGGDGIDTLVMNNVIIAGGSPTPGGGTIQGYVSLSQRYYVSYDGIERIYINGELRSGIDLGDTEDELHFSPRTLTADISTGGGNDKIYLSGGFDVVAVDGGEGNDLIDVSATRPEHFPEYDIRGGAGNDTLVSGSLSADQLRGGTGDDNYVVNGAQVDVIELEGEGTDTVSTALDGYTLSAFVENLTLTGAAVTGYGNSLDNLLTGSAIANRLYGMEGSDTIDAGGGNDWLDGGTGADALSGGTGDDAYWIDDVGDQVIEASGGGTDKVFSSLFRTELGAHVENLQLTGAAVSGYGNALDNIITGNAGANALYGSGGNDRLDGGAGPDRMSGGDGDDTYFVDDGFLSDGQGDRAIEASATGGIDTVYASVTYDLTYQYVERLFLTGSADINAWGNSLDNVLVGNGGNNVIDGAGGVDVMNGGAGNDIYFVDTAGETVIEPAGGGSDEVRSSVTFFMSNAYEIETLVLTGWGAINGYGNNLNNWIYGTPNNNVISGGAGIDRMEGHGGNDTYYVDNINDVVVEASADGGYDTIYASVSYDIAGQYVERLFLDAAGTANGWGNSLDNRIYGNDWANIIDGRLGADLMVGRGGDDRYYVDNSGDRVVEEAGGGNDTAYSTVSFGLAGVHVETLILTGTAITGTGNSLANTIRSEPGGNTMHGLGGDDVLVSDALGGSGNHLFGGTGNDTLISENSDEDRFYFDTALDPVNNVDTIEGFDTVGYDQFQLSRAIFTEIGAGLLSEDAFHTGTAAADAEDRIVYDIASGKVYYDADGSGAGAAVLFAQVDPGSGLAYYHFFAF